MRVELLAVGTELLFGDIVNGNAAWLGRRLAEVGADVTTSVVVGDNVDRIASSVTTALSRADAVVITGGIGPTQDDLTREALAAAAGVPLVRDPDLEAGLRTRFAALRRDVPEMNYKQADLPAGARPIANPRGSAPGVRVEIGSGVAYALPGVPHEMERMFTDDVLPDLLRLGGQPAAIVHRVLRTAGMWESAVAAALEPQVARLERDGGVTVAFLASGGQTRVRLTAKAETYDAAVAMIAPEEAAARAALGSAVYGTDDDTLEGVVVALLRDRSATVATAESLTGGLLGAELSRAPGSSDVYLGGVVTYATEVKRDLLGVPEEVIEEYGVISDECAAAMATGVRDRLGATYGVSLTGVAGPTEQEGKPVGTVHIGIAGPAGAFTRALRLPGDRPQVRTYAVVAAENLLRLHLLGE
ncbi:MAG: nicotinamide-nucleotide amidase [Frankiaceae bacterium]|jgi:nicotinamide-nucleotide amidase|nr:nicotinamide-nucleotide amidase [Frankiaceae bacterium]